MVTDFGLAKRVAWSAPVALADVRAIGAPLDAKINDVLVAGMTGALRTYLRTPLAWRVLGESPEVGRFAALRSGRSPIR